jgi:hypothetical protein
VTAMDARVRGLGISMATAAGCAALTVISGCVTPPEAAREQRTTAQTLPQTQRPFSNALEERHQAQAQAHAREGNWADALVHWELLALLRPESTAYRDAVATTRKHIRDTADSLMRAAGEARRSGNVDQAVLLFLRVLNVDREHAAAAQALRDIEAERTQRAYVKRPPRGAM